MKIRTSGSKTMPCNECGEITDDVVMITFASHTTVMLCRGCMETLMNRLKEENDGKEQGTCMQHNGHIR